MIRLNRKLIGISITSFLLASMLGQLDIILGNWYSNLSNTWELPFPFVFNEKISALIGWEIIYGLIVVSYFGAIVLLS